MEEEVEVGVINLNTAVFPTTAEELQGMSWEQDRECIDVIAQPERTLNLKNWVENKLQKALDGGKDDMVEVVKELHELTKALLFDVMCSATFIGRKVFDMDTPETVKGDVLHAMGYLISVSQMAKDYEQFCAFETYLFSPSEAVNAALMAHTGLCEAWKTIKEYV